jgi:Holliday junction resolvase RusA-like endonuclease
MYASRKANAKREYDNLLKNELDAIEEELNTEPNDIFYNYKGT